MRYHVKPDAKWRSLIRQYSAGGESVGAEGTWIDPSLGAQLTLGLETLLEEQSPTVQGTVIAQWAAADVDQPLLVLYVGLGPDSIARSLTLVGVSIASNQTNIPQGNLGVGSNIAIAPSGLSGFPATETEIDAGPVVSGQGALTNWSENGSTFLPTPPSGFYARESFLGPGTALPTADNAAAYSFKPIANFGVIRPESGWNGMALIWNFGTLPALTTARMTAVVSLTPDPEAAGAR